MHLTSFRVHISEDANEKDKKERLLEAESRSHALASASSKLTKTGEQLALLRRRKQNWFSTPINVHRNQSAGNSMEDKTTHSSRRNSAFYNEKVGS